MDYIDAATEEKEEMKRAVRAQGRNAVIRFPSSVKTGFSEPVLPPSPWGEGMGTAEVGTFL